MSALATIPIDHVRVGDRLRRLDDDQVARLMESIGEVGLLNPITVHEANLVNEIGSGTIDGYRIVAGAHRLEACRRLGHEDIPAHVVDLSDLERQIAECDENLCGSKLTASERARFIKRRKEAYEALHPETRHGVAGANATNGAATDNLSFADNTAAKTGVTPRTVQRDAERGAKVITEALDMIRGTKLDTGAYLDKLKRLPPNEQMHAVKRDLREARQKQERPANQSRVSSKVQADIKVRAAQDVAEMIAEHVPGAKWDTIKANLYSAGAANIANALANIVGESVMDGGDWR